jgi:serine protease inhibitor
MKKFLLIILVIISICCVYACKKEEAAKPEWKQVDLTEKQKQVVSSSNTFGFEFFKRVNEISGSNVNLMVSPLSVSMALGMTRNGAANATLADMTTTLGFEGQNETEINESYKYIVETFANLDPDVKLQIANSIWYRNNFVVEQPFVQANQQYFDATVTPLDFSDPTAADIINAWVNEKTNELIPKIIDEIPVDARMYLVNAVYFKGVWKYKFNKDLSALKPFTLMDASVIQVPTMVERASLNYFKGADFEAIELPYNQGNYTMTVLLPDADKSINDVISQLSQANSNAWSRQFVATDIQLQFPQFKYEYEEKNMKPILTALGMGVAFTDNADFTRIYAAGNLCISRVLHKTYIETNEDGTEAAAVTAVEVGVTSAGPPEPLFVSVNRPFVYFIQEKSTGTILFIGTVMNPNE